MKLIRFGPFGAEKPGVLDAGGKRRDCSGLFADWNAAFWASDGLTKLRGFLEERIDALPVVPPSERWGAPIARPGKTLCVGLNYRAHAQEMGSELPEEPLIFCKAPNAMVGPFDGIRIPRFSEKTDYEVELGVVIGKRCSYLNSDKEAAERVAGYAISNDVSERDFQKNRGGQWVKGKSCDTFHPFGPWLATRDELGEADGLTMITRVNGRDRQNSHTGDQIFKPSMLVRYLSQFMTLEPGDVISTGTPSGVAAGMRPPLFLRSGDVVEMSIEGLGHMCQICEPA